MVAQMVRLVGPESHYFLSCLKNLCYKKIVIMGFSYLSEEVSSAMMTYKLLLPTQDKFPS